MRGKSLDWLLRAALGGLVLAGLSCRRSAEPPAPAPEVKLQVLDETHFADTLKQYRGRVVLVDYWALWCPPCLELFPHTVELSRTFAGQGLAVVSVSLDGEEKEAEVRKYLAAQGATFDNYLASHGMPEAIEPLQIDNGTLPLLKLFDREGNLRATFPKPQSGVKPAEVEEAVRKLLAEKDAG